MGHTVELVFSLHGALGPPAVQGGRMFRSLPALTTIPRVLWGEARRVQTVFGRERRPSKSIVCSFCPLVKTNQTLFMLWSN